MTKATVLVDQVLLLANEKYAAHIKVYEVANYAKYPSGYKVRCALIERMSGGLIVLLDNHEPFGFHIHTKLPDKNPRTSFDVDSYEEAIEIFFNEVRRVINE